MQNKAKSFLSKYSKFLLPEGMFAAGTGPAGITQLQEMIGRIIGISVGIAFVALLIMLIIGGIKYLTSGGEQKSVASAQQTLTWAILGIIFLAVAWIALLMVGSISGVNVTSFCLQFSGCP